MELFHNTSGSGQPLAARMRPRTLDEFVGQEHILGPGRLLRRAIQADQLSSLIFYGPPGTGKTTLAMVIANTTESRFDTINAVLSGVKQIREAIDKAVEQRDLHGRRTILFVDEVHRWNKAQQDALLPWVENGTVILIGATTQNPYFEVNSALVSRSRIFQLKPLSREDLLKAARAALNDKERGYGAYDIELEPGALEHIADVASGDARSLLNALELAVETTPRRFPPEAGEKITLSMETAEESIQKKAVLYDKEGDYHFDTISAFIKSIRGSDPDAVLYWLARMVRAGEDPKYIFRRMLIAASEDIGLADPQALAVTVAAAAAFDRIGLPEGQFLLTQAALYLATAPKSNSALGYFDALKEIEEGEAADVPSHLKDASRDKKGFGHGEGYLYPHAYRDHWVAQQYLPGPLQGKLFYRPSEQGYEASVRETVIRRREAQLEASFTGRPAEVCSYSPPDKGKERWIERSLSGFGPALESLREKLFEGLDIGRSGTILDIAPGSGMVMFEALRRVPEGGVYGLAADEGQAKLLRARFELLPDAERPEVIPADISRYSPKEGLLFDFILGRDPLTRRPDRGEVFTACRSLMAPRARLSVVQVVPSKGQRLSELYRGRAGEDPVYDALRKAEEIVYSHSGNPLTNWNDKELITACEAADLEVIDSATFTVETERTLHPRLLDRWLDPEESPYGYGAALRDLAAAGGSATSVQVGAALNRVLGSVTVSWKSTYLRLLARKPVVE